MSKPLKYIRDLEAAGFRRNQAEAQVRVFLDAIEDDFMTKNDFVLFRGDIDRQFADIDRQFADVERRFIELELRLVIKLGLISVITTTIAVSILAWLIKVD